MSSLDNDMLFIAGVRLELDADGKPLNYVFLTDDERRLEAKSRRKDRENEKKKQRHAQRVAEENKEDSPARTARIRWGNVDSFYFTDTIGYGVVPSKGFYPLGMGAEEEAHRTSLSVDEAEKAYQEMLLHRAQLCGMCVDPTSSGASSTPATTQAAASAAAAAAALDVGRLETRQFDYKKKGLANPLFCPLSEEERQLRLLQHAADDSHAPSSAAHAHASAPAAPVEKQSPPRKANKRRSLSVTDSLKEAERKPRASSFEFDSTMGLGQDMSVSSLNKELRAIRTSRADGGGCLCRPLKVDKLSVVKLRQELESHGTPEAEVSALGKTELMGALKEVLKDCALCRDNGCVCVREGIECRSDTCDCLRHGLRGGHKACQNPHGADIFDAAAVQQHRTHVLEVVRSPTK